MEEDGSIASGLEKTEPFPIGFSMKVRGNGTIHPGGGRPVFWALDGRWRGGGWGRAVVLIVEVFVFLLLMVMLTGNVRTTLHNGLVKDRLLL